MDFIWTNVQHDVEEMNVFKMNDDDDDDDDDDDVKCKPLLVESGTKIV